VIIPAWNEAAVIGRVVGDLLRTGGAVHDQMDVLVIDDGSSDDTRVMARSAGAEVLTMVENLGYGYALQTGYRVGWQENYAYIVQMDGDGQHAPESIPGLLAPVLAGECDVAIGSRGLSDAKYPMPLPRRVGQKIFGFLLRCLSGLEIKDPTSGFQAINRRALGLYLTDDFPGDYPDANMLLYRRLNGIKIREVPAIFRVNDRGKSMHGGFVKPVYYIYKMTLSMLLIYLRHRRNGTRTGTP
jgi:glycosyltransferase involved in cell wall biosynthesis